MIKEEIRKTFRGKVRTDFMIGMEIEKTPAFNLTTLFVQGYKSYEEIYSISKENDIEHVYLGANRSYEPGHDWNALISALLNEFVVTLDYRNEFHTPRLTKDVWSHEKFIPMITIDVSNLCGLSKNLTLKIDDTEFVSPGIWCVNYKDVADSKKFTAWDEYSSDAIIR
jgi:hypothetical protein